MPEFKLINEKTYGRRGITLWRYFDLHKFYSFLKNGEIRFTRMDVFEDPLEGIPLRALAAYEEHRAIGEEGSLSDIILEEARLEKLPPRLKGWIKSIRAIQHSSFVSCWFLENRESMAMWNLYSNPDGVAVRLPLHYLTAHFRDYAESLEKEVSAFYGGKVLYQDFTALESIGEDITEPKVALRKDRSYQHEQEFRFVIRTRDHHLEKEAFITRLANLKSLPLKVVCHPLMMPWKKDNIRQMLADAGLEKAFMNSEIRLRR